MAILTSLIIKRTSSKTQIKDLGRLGVAHLGFTQGGANDAYAFNWSNYLVGNPKGTAVIEVTLGNLEIEFCEELCFSITGADCLARLGESKLEHWSSHTAKKGQTLKLSMPRNGLITYIAFQGQFDLDPLLNSLTCVNRELIGGHKGDGSYLTPGTQLTVIKPKSIAKPTGSQVSYLYWNEPFYRPIKINNSPVKIRFIANNQIEDFNHHQLSTFCENEYVITTQANSMGYQLNGVAIEPTGVSLASEGLASGAIQIPPKGQPIVMLNEKQTIGGYHKIGTVVKMDLNILSQLRPGQKIRFIPCSRKDALDEWLSWERFFRL